ncbi:hypothetical protein MPPM_3863 [Methylorubrum populi]|uniref:Uncharacterized protein n=1 Tax=Methylorubrum populi TaxID=223967 RepID=A0A161JML5_9HYPH|nr:hypothetical protein [Methylorubrum populi]BAU92468.1 hypothetical protein MPPM_3863 [Methylorubrum populi]
MSDTRISAADLLRLAAIASVSPEGTADEVVAILQRTGPAEASEAPADPPGTKLFGTAAEGDDARPAADTADSDKLAKPE